MLQNLYSIKMAGKKSKKDNEPLSQAQEEEMSSALIAQILAEDGMSNGNGSYYAEYSNDSKGYDPYHTQHERDDSYEENSEDDFDPKKKRYVSKKDAVKKGRKRKAPAAAPTPKVSKKEVKETASTDKTNEGEGAAAAAAAVADANSEQEVTSTIKEKPAKKAKKPVVEGMNSGVYTELEEKHFLEGLETYGRDWGKLQQLVATRDSNSIRSHAQKHFIKMFRDQIPLPAKVRESGEGYTLSGKPLDPNSAAAKPYLSRNGSVSIPVKPETKVVEEKKDDPMEDVEQEKKKQETTAQPMEVDAATNAVEKQTKELSIGEKSKKTAENKTLKKKASSKSATPSPSSSSVTSDPYDAKGRTNYSTSRLRKQRDTSANYGQISNNEDPLTLIKCEPFTGKPGSNVNGSQPFEISVNSNVLVAMDFHAHLMTTEIIGFLAGEWDKETMKMTIREAYPCRSIETGQNDVNVEMDPTSAIETRQAIEERNLKVVGWYHSHPTFIPDPSLVDIENQRNYQVLCRDNHHHQDMGQISLEPFVGAIVGPYDPALPGSSSVINWFHVSNTNSERPVPKKLIYELTENENISQEESDRLFELLPRYKESSEKVTFAEHWRQDATESKLQKMIRSLASRMPWIQKQLKSEEQSSLEDTFLLNVQASLKDW